MGTRHLTEAQRARVRTLFFDGIKTKNQICKTTGYSRDQVKKALRDATPKKRSGHPTALTPTQDQELIEFISASNKNRRMSFPQLSMILF